MVPTDAPPQALNVLARLLKLEDQLAYPLFDDDAQSNSPSTASDSSSSTTGALDHSLFAVSVTFIVTTFVLACIVVYLMRQLSLLRGAGAGGNVGINAHDDSRTFNALTKPLV